MNVTQFLAWIICLALAFFACVLTARNTGKTAMLERQLATVQAVATDQTAAVREVSVVLKQIENDLKPGAGQAALDQLARQVQQLRERLDTVEARPAAPQP